MVADRGCCARKHVDNRTGWYVDVYVNRSYVGVVGPYGDLYPYVCEGSELLGDAEGTPYYWGPITSTCGGNWLLND